MTLPIGPNRPYSLDELKEYVKHLRDLFINVGKLERRCKNKPSTVGILGFAGSTIGILYEQSFQENSNLVSPSGMVETPRL